MKFSKIITFIVLFTNIFSEDCWNFNGEYPCQGDQKEYPQKILRLLRQNSSERDSILRAIRNYIPDLP